MPTGSLGAGCSRSPPLGFSPGLAVFAAEMAGFAGGDFVAVASWRSPRKLVTPNQSEAASRNPAATLPKTISTVGGRLAAGMFRTSRVRFLACGLLLRGGVFRLFQDRPQLEARRQQRGARAASTRAVHRSAAQAVRMEFDGQQSGARQGRIERPPACGRRRHGTVCRWVAASPAWVRPSPACAPRVPAAAHGNSGACVPGWPPARRAAYAAAIAAPWRRPPRRPAETRARPGRDPQPVCRVPARVQQRPGARQFRAAAGARSNRHRHGGLGGHQQRFHGFRRGSGSGRARRREHLLPTSGTAGSAIAASCAAEPAALRRARPDRRHDRFGIRYRPRPAIRGTCGAARDRAKPAASRRGCGNGGALEACR